MKYLLSFILFISMSNILFGQQAQHVLLAKFDAPQKEVKFKTPQTEAEDFLFFLQNNFTEPERLYIKGFTSYAVPPELRSDAAVQLSFIMHSMVGISSNDEDNAGSYYPIAIAEYEQEDIVWDRKKIKYVQNVPNSDTLFWIDIRNYNWSVQSWENITKYDGYIVQPILSEETNGLLRLYSGNALVRTDWFIYHSARTVEQTDTDKTAISIYRELLYSKTTPPKTVDDFRKTWSLTDLVKSRVLGNESGTLVTKGKNVARHNRLLFEYRTELGWLYQTYDVITERGNRDYVETFYDLGGKPPKVFDGGEIFASNVLKLQVYDIYDAKEKLLDVADAAIVRHLSDVLGDTRVVTPHSCFDCHAEGPIPSENTISDFLKARGGLYLKNKADQLRIDRAFYNKRFEDSILEHQVAYAKALAKTNGLKTSDNLRSYYRLITWYNKPLTVEQVAFECGVTVDQLKLKAKEGLQGINNKIPGRLSMLLTINEPIPRSLWEAPNTDGVPGIFQQTMVVINGLTRIETEIVTKIEAVIINGCKIYKQGTEVIKTVIPNTKIISINSTEAGWSNVTLEDGTTGWVQSKNIGK
jgi:hypothetical protein